MPLRASPVQLPRSSLATRAWVVSEMTDGAADSWPWLFMAVCFLVIFGLMSLSFSMGMALGAWLLKKPPAASPKSSKQLPCQPASTSWTCGPAGASSLRPGWKSPKGHYPEPGRKRESTSFFSQSLKEQLNGLTERLSGPQKIHAGVKTRSLIHGCGGVSAVIVDQPPGQLMVSG